MQERAERRNTTVTNTSTATMDFGTSPFIGYVQAGPSIADPAAMNRAALVGVGSKGQKQATIVNYLPAKAGTLTYSASSALSATPQLTQFRKP